MSSSFVKCRCDSQNSWTNQLYVNSIRTRQRRSSSRHNFRICIHISNKVIDLYLLPKMYRQIFWMKCFVVTWKPQWPYSTYARRKTAIRSQAFQLNNEITSDQKFNQMFLSERPVPLSMLIARAVDSIDKPDTTSVTHSLLLELIKQREWQTHRLWATAKKRGILASNIFHCLCRHAIEMLTRSRRRDHRLHLW